MSLRDTVLSEVDSIIGEHLDGVFGVIERSILRKQAEPKRWAAFHSEMARRLPQWRWLAREWHKLRSRRFQSMVKASPMTAALGKAFPSV